MEGSPGRGLGRGKMYFTATESHGVLSDWLGGDTSGSELVRGALTGATGPERQHILLLWEPDPGEFSAEKAGSERCQAHEIPKSAPRGGAPPLPQEVKTRRWRPDLQMVLITAPSCCHLGSGL